EPAGRCDGGRRHRASLPDLQDRARHRRSRRRAENPSHRSPGTHGEVARVVWTPQALADLDATCEYIAHDLPAFARAFARRAFTPVGRLHRFPGPAASSPNWSVMTCGK